MINRIIAFSFLFFLTGCATQTTEVKSGPAHNLSGGWEVDYKLTENAQEKLLFLYEVARSQIVQRQSRRDQADNALANRVALQQSLDDLNGLIRLGTLADSMNRSAVLRIAQSTGHIVIEREDDYALTCEYERNQVSKLGAEWCGFNENGELIFQTRLPEGLDIEHRFVLSDDGERLSVTTMVRTPVLSQPYTINRIYMPFEAGSSMYNCEFTLKKKKTCWLGPSQ